MIEFKNLTLEEYLLIKNIVIAARCHLQYGRNIDKTECLEDIERAERALVRAFRLVRVDKNTPTPVLEEEHTREGILLCP